MTIEVISFYSFHFLFDKGQAVHTVRCVCVCVCMCVFVCVGGGWGRA